MEKIYNTLSEVFLVLSFFGVFGTIVVAIHPFVENLDIIAGRDEYARKRDGWYNVLESVFSEWIGIALILSTIVSFALCIYFKFL